MTGMKRIITFIAIMFLIFGSCAYVFAPEPSLEGRDTYKGLPVYQYNAEDKTVSIDGVLYESVEGWEFPEQYKIGDFFGYLWYYPHYQITEGVIYDLKWMEPKEDSGDPKKYIYAVSSYYDTEDGTKEGEPIAPIFFALFFERVDTD